MDLFLNESISLKEKLMEAGRLGSFGLMEGAFHASETVLPNLPASMKIVEMQLTHLQKAIEICS